MTGAGLAGLFLRVADTGQGPIPGAAGPPMMEDEASVALFVSLIVVVSLAAAVVLPIILGRLALRTSVPALAVVGPVLGIIGSLIGTLAMTLSGHDIWYSLVVSACTGTAAIFVGLRLARPVARDLDQVVSAVEAVAEGDRGARTGIERAGEIGRLAGAVDELGRSLARAEMERAAAEDERRAVVSALSHDLRTPLASLLASVDAMEDGVGERSVHLRAMRGNVLALESLVGDLFLLARADAGSLALGREPLDLAELIDEAVEAVVPVASAKGVGVVARAGAPLVVEGDHQSLGRILRNLLDNAIRHSPGESTVTVIGTRHGQRARIEVHDEGAGFPPEFVSRAFERFARADDARSGIGGAGLGLAIAHTLVEVHQGSMEILDGPGGRVRFEIPLLAGSPSRAQSEREAPELTPR